MRVLEGRVALVTGGGSGIGRAAALALAREGARVVVANRRVREGEETVGLIQAAGGEAAFARADLHEPGQIDALFETARRLFGPVTIGFNNAGVQERRTLLAEAGTDLYQQVFDVNVRAVLLCMQHEIRHMLEAGGGVVINNASVSGTRNSPRGSASTPRPRRRCSRSPDRRPWSTGPATSASTRCHPVGCTPR